MCRDTIVCIVTGGQPLCRDTRCDTAPSALRHGVGAMRHARHGFWVTIQFLYRDRGATFYVMIRRSKATIQRSTALRYGARALRHSRQRARERARQGVVLRYKFCIVTKGRRHVARHGLRHGQCALRHYNDPYQIIQV